MARDTFILLILCGRALCLTSQTYLLYLSTSVSCSVLFPLMKEGSEFGATSPNVVQTSSSTSCWFGFLILFFFLPEVSLHKTIELHGAGGGDTGMHC